MSESEQVKELKRRIYSLEAQLEVSKNKTNSMAGGTLLQSNPIDLYPGEQLDFVLSVLSQIKDRCPPDSRAYEISCDLLERNHPVGYGQEMMDEIRGMFRSGVPYRESELSRLNQMGFTYVQSRKHPKLRFHNRTIVLPATPSDYRSGKNCLSEFGKLIAPCQKV